MNFEKKEIVLANSTVELQFINKNAPFNLIVFHGLGSKIANIFDWNKKTYTQKYNVYAPLLPAIMGIYSYPDELTVENLLGIYLDLIKKFKLTKITLLAHSMGAAFAAMVQAKVPNLIEQIVLVAPSNREATFEDAKTFNKIFKPETFEDFIFSLNLTLHDASKMYDSLAKEKQLRKVFNNLQKTRYQNQDYLAFLPILKSLKNLDEVDQGYQKSRQVHLIVGSSDRLVNTQKTINYFQNLNVPLQIYEIPKSGHRPWVENYDQYHQALSSALNYKYRERFQKNS